MKWNLPFMIGYIVFVANAQNSTRTNKYTYGMALLCKEETLQHGYRYERFFRMDSKDLRKIKKDVDIAFEMHIAIQAGSNGHILLSPVPDPGPSDPVYEIVVGGGSNKFTELRRNLKRNAKASLKTPGILSPIDLRGFYVRQSEDGVIAFGEEGQTVPLIHYYDVDPLEIKYFSFAAWAGVEAKILYDCPAPGEVSDANVPDSQAIEHKVSTSDDLKRLLLMGRIPSIAPSRGIPVTLGIRVTNLRYNPLNSKLVTRLAVVMSWKDDSMAWNPSKYNGTVSLKFRQGQIWRPTFFVFNSDNLGVFDTRNPDPILMFNSGVATFHFQTQINTWCQPPSAMYKWPRDEYSCNIIIQPWETYESITFKMMDANDNRIRMFANIDEIILNEWAITRYKHDILTRMQGNDIDNQTHHSDQYIITLDFKREGSTYCIVLYTPLLVLVAFVLISFWTESLNISRVWFYCGYTVVMAMGLCNIDYLIPTHTVPTILILYTTVFMGVLVALLVQAALISPVTENICTTSLIRYILLSKTVRMMFCLPPIKTSVNGSYYIQEDDDANIVTHNLGNVEEMETEDEGTFGDKKELAELIDKLMFTVYTVVFASLLAAHY